MGTLDDKVAWVTGAGTGIGLAGALELARAGAFVILSGRRKAVLDEACDRIVAEGGKAVVEPLDVAEAEAVKIVAQRILERFGAVDILVNSAGLNLPNRFFKDATTASWNTIIDINLNGTMYCIQAVLPAMRQRRQGLVINISSWAGRYPSTVTGPAYNASKHAIIALTYTFNMEECGHGLRACVIMPGEVATPIMQQRPVPPSEEEMAKMLQEEDLGRTIRFVAEMPPRVCINEILISPTYNRTFLGGPDIEQRFSPIARP